MLMLHEVGEFLVHPWAAVFSMAPSLGESRCVDPNVGLISGLLRCPRGLEQTSSQGCQEVTALKMCRSHGMLPGEELSAPPPPKVESMLGTMGSIQP